MLRIVEVIKEYKDCDQIRLDDNNILNVRHNDGLIMYCDHPEKLWDYYKAGHIKCEFLNDGYNTQQFIFV